MYKAVFFDLDGTLLDTLEDLADSVNEMLRKYSCPERSLDEIRQFVGNGMKKLVESSVSENFDKKDFDSAYEFFRSSYGKNMQNKTHPYDGIEECLEDLKKAGIKTVVISNKNDDAVKSLCEKYFPGLVTFAVGVKEGIPPKPDPAMIFSAEEKIGLKKEECIFVGDSDTDMLTAKNVGMKSVGVLWGFRDRGVLENSGADFIVSSPRDITKIINFNGL